MTELVTDAQNRALRTFLQGIAIDVLAGVSIAVHGLLTSTDPFSWALLGALVLKSAGVAATSYVMRRWLDPSGFPTPLPPPTAGPPNEDEPPDAAP
jgi:hypothetical protein